LGAVINDDLRELQFFTRAKQTWLSARRKQRFSPIDSGDCQATIATVVSSRGFSLSFVANGGSGADPIHDFAIDVDHLFEMLSDFQQPSFRM
jgi:hypothetical protein